MVALKRVVGTFEPVGVALLVILLFLVAFAGVFLDRSESGV